MCTGLRGENTAARAMGLSCRKTGAQIVPRTEGRPLAKTRTVTAGERPEILCKHLLSLFVKVFQGFQVFHR